MTQTTQPPKYHYDPSLAAAATFAALFGISTIVHFFQLRKHKTWYFIVFFIGVIFQVIGYAARAVNANETPNWSQGPFIIQTLLILLSPALFAASIYMILGRLIRALDAEDLSIVRTKWMTKIFVIGDVLSFAAQCIGGGMLSGAKTIKVVNRGQDIILIGLGIQILFFGGFIGVISVFHHRILHNPTVKSLNTTLPWKQYIIVLYIASLLIMVRSIFRVAEFAAGQTSVLQTAEGYLYGLDAVLMFICAVLFNILHPSRVVQTDSHKPLTDMEMGDRSVTGLAEG
ncbi:RTA1 like protein-domain-containing protein [Ilyonectria robusta]|uniref:RTA1 like protein-domain-containing protein n=1 Tax=Ilyonectria robusta TaxID=1079257 RepID=UPI001E8CAF1C|nr:RTA1 like protein-domain-containing protein [Ilyonectria robusta]KAH8685059.1 RTA1 like protein-domain-containing protein [Ilyonectria robusta]